MASKAILAIGIAVAIVLFVGPLGGIAPWVSDMINSLFRQGDISQGGDTSTESEAVAETGSQGDNISGEQEGSTAGGSEERVSERTLNDGEERVGEKG